MPHITLRPFRRKDSADVAQMMRALASFHHEKSSVTPSYIAKYALGLNKRFDFIVAADGDKLVGFIATSYAYNIPLMQYRARTEYLWVEKTYRQRGLGKRLVQAAILAAMKKDCDLYTITAQPSNTMANSVYRALKLKATKSDHMIYTANQELMKKMAPAPKRKKIESQK